MQPQTIRTKAVEPILLLGPSRFGHLDIRVRVKGGGYTSQIYGAWPRADAPPHEALTAGCAAIRQAIARAVVAYYQKCEWPQPRSVGPRMAMPCSGARVVCCVVSSCLSVAMKTQPNRFRKRIWGQNRLQI